jgi:hypothetical protein
MVSASFIEVPPNFMTMGLVGGVCISGQRLKEV